MKKLLLTILASASFTTFAMQTVNFNTQKYTCNNVPITKTTPESTLVANCKGAKVRTATAVVGGGTANRPAGGGGNSVTINDMDDDATDANLERVKFYADDGTYMKCYYKDSKLLKCKAKVKPKAKQASATKSN